jgi:hypothetical protein
LGLRLRPVHTPVLKLGLRIVERFLPIIAG